jgi:hypothetical protein
MLLNLERNLLKITEHLILHAYFINGVPWRLNFCPGKNQTLKRNQSYKDLKAHVQHPGINYEISYPFENKLYHKEKCRPSNSMQDSRFLNMIISLFK